MSQISEYPRKKEAAREGDDEDVTYIYLRVMNVASYVQRGSQHGSSLTRTHGTRVVNTLPLQD